MTAVEEATPERTALVRLACSIPLGWRLGDGKLASPWAALGDRAWATRAGRTVPLACSLTRRPALLAGPAVILKAEPLPPKARTKWNPDGDGLFRITVANPTDRPARVNALLTDGKTLLWRESLLVLCNGRPRLLPGARGVTDGVRPMTLASKESVSTVVDVLALDGVAWPRSGDRVALRFCLGELGTGHSFYYYPRHHDPRRARGAGKAGAGD